MIKDNNLYVVCLSYNPWLDIPHHSRHGRSLDLKSHVRFYINILIAIYRFLHPTNARQVSRNTFLNRSVTRECRNRTCDAEEGLKHT